MNDRRLQIYLDDHIALMVAENALIDRCYSRNQSTPLGEFLRRLGYEVQAQKAIATDVTHRMGFHVTVEGRLKQAAAWFAEKLGRFKLNDAILAYSDLSRVVELEILAVAAQERIALWDNLNAAAATNSRFQGIAFSFFRDQSQQHLDELQRRRRFAAVEAFADEQ